MSKDRQRGQASKDDPAAIGDRTGESECPVIVVGIGASAGGLKSLKRLFARVPPGHGVAFVLIQHPEPSRKSRTVELLRDRTALAVVEAREGMPVVADRIHVMPPDKFLNISGARLTLHDPVHCDGLWMPIDHFFCALAVDQRQRACGIVLSGTGSDGTVGLSEIKAAGGRTLVEDPGSAEYPDMPQSAIDAGVVDAVLPAEAMAEAIVALAKQVAESTRSEPAESPEFDANLRAVLDILRAKVGYDFRCYKPTTLVRRIRRRMTLAKVAQFADYARFLNDHPDEVGLLQKDLLIGVTEFFRQPPAWEILEERVIATVVENARPGSEIRVWVPGCSTGQEAYSLAMLLTEQVERSGKQVGIQIFATDSDSSVLATARSGSYSEGEIGENVSAERVKRFFARRDGRYQVIKKVRERVVFAPQNITADPPFSRLDLISCRNLLIYLDQQVQRKIIALFHFALREGGFLFLGTAETVGDRDDLFEPVSKKWRIYRRIGVGRPVGVEIPVRPTGRPPSAPGKLPVAASPPRMGLALTAQQVLLERFAPACVMIDRKFHVLYVHGAVEDYLTFPPGELTTRVVDMAREGLRARLRGAVSKCLEVSRSVSVTARVRRGEKSVPVKATVSPVRYPREADGLLLITFEDYRVPAAKSRRRATGESDLQHLEDELKVTREELKSTVEQLESSNDQLKASNEEVTAANEELQSANEELETSKEELQSLNEELNTINARLQEKVDELESTNNDVVNFLSSTNIATVFLDKDLKVKRYTPAMTRLLSLIPSDVGRPVVDVLRRFRDKALLEDAARVLAELTPLAKEVQANDGRWYIRRITPYRTQDDRIEGVVVTFVEVSDLKETEQALRQSEERFRAVVEQAAIGIEQLELNGRTFGTNPMMTQILGYTADELRRKTFEDITHPEDRPRERELLDQLLEGKTPSYTIEKRYLKKDGRPVWVRVTSSLTRDASSKPISRISIIEDISERKQAEEALRRLNAELEERVAEQTAEIRRTYEAVKMERQRFNDVLEMLPAYVVLLTPDHHVPFANRFFRERFGESHGRRSFEYLVGRTEPCETCETYTVLKTNAPHHWEWTGPDGRNYDIFDFPFTDTDGSPLIMEMGIDITDLKRAEKSLKEANETLERRVAERTAELAAARIEALSEKNRLEAVMEALPVGVALVDAQGANIRSNKAFERVWGAPPRPPVASVSDYAAYRAWWVDTANPVQPEEWGSARAVQKGETVIGQMMEIESFDGVRKFIMNSAAPVHDAEGKIIGSAVAIQDISDFKRAEQALRRSEAQLQTILENLTEGLVVADIEGRLLQWNQAALKMHGFASLDEARRRLPEFADTFELATMDGTVLPVDEWPLARILRGEELRDWVLRVRRLRSDWQRILSYGGTLVRDVNRQPLLAVVSVRDITERKAAEEALRESANTLRIVADFTYDWECWRGPEDRLLYVSPSCERITGYTREEFMDDAELYLRIIHPEDRERVVAHLSEGQFDRPGCEMEFRILRRDGQERWIGHACQPVLDEHGQSLGRRASDRDITERKRAEDALRESEERLNRAQEIAHLGSWELDVVNNRLTWSDEVYRIFGLEPQEFGATYEAFLEAVHPDDRAAVDAAYSGSLRENRDSYEIEHRVVRRSSSEVRLVHEKCEHFRDGSGRIIRSMGMVHDITERKQAEEALRASEEALRQANEQLEERVRERTLELRALMEDLEKSRDDLRKLASELVLAEEQERKRISVVLHDEVAQTLAAARTRLELLRNMPCNDDFRQSITQAQELIGQSIRETRALMTDISSPVLYEMGLRSAVETLAREVTARHGLPVACAFEGSPGPLDPDLRVMLFQVVKELVQNVVKHGRARNASIRIVEEKDSIRVVVADNGQGFDVRKLGSPGFEGGFGLFSIRERVHFFNGNMAIESNPGAGTEVTVVLPKAAGNRESAKEAKERENGKTDPTCS